MRALGFWLVFLAMLALASVLTGCERRETLLTVHASASTRAAPDLAIVTLGVVARGQTARAAQEAQSVRMNAVTEAARAAGVADNDIQTVAFSLDPQYTYPRNAPPRISGYQSRNTISIRVRNLEAVSGLIDAAVADGANELQGIQFGFEDEEASRNAARAQALGTARARAQTYASAAGMRVVRMLSITEPGGTVPVPYGTLDAARTVAAEQASNSPISPGEQEARGSVTVVFELR